MGFPLKPPWACDEYRGVAQIASDHVVIPFAMNHKTLEKTLTAALTHQRAGELDAAAKLYLQVRRSAPNVYDGWYLSGTNAIHRDQPTEAIPYLTRAMQLARGGREASQCRLFLGIAYADTGRSADAVPLLRAALGKHPEYEEAWEALTQALIVLDRPMEAADCIRAWQAAHPGRTDLQERLAALESPIGLAT